MANIFEDDFNSYNNGDLNGQGSWIADAVYDVQDSTVYEGAKAIQINCTGTDNYCRKTGTGQADGRISFYMRASNVTSTYDVIMLRTTAGAEVTRLRWLGATIAIQLNLAYTALTTTAAANTWYLIEWEWRSADGKHRARIDGGAYTDWGSPNAAGTPGQWYINNYSSPSTHTFYLDYIAENPYSPPATATNPGWVSKNGWF
jgi:hypothetical protein